MNRIRILVSFWAILGVSTIAHKVDEAPFLPGVCDYVSELKVAFAMFDDQACILEEPKQGYLKQAHSKARQAIQSAHVGNLTQSFHRVQRAEHFLKQAEGDCEGHGDFAFDVAVSLSQCPAFLMERAIGHLEEDPSVSRDVIQRMRAIDRTAHNDYLQWFKYVDSTKEFTEILKIVLDTMGTETVQGC